MKRPARAALLCAALLLAGCTGAIKPAANSEQAQRNWQQRRAALQQMRDFALQGRMAATGVVSFGGDLSWRQDGERFQVRFFGPLGVGAVAISGMPGEMEIRTKDGDYLTQEPEALMEDKLGFSLPVDGLRYWVLGLPAPGEEPQLQLDDAGRVRAMEQNGWLLEYSDYQTVGTLELPRKFTLHGADRGFRVVIDQWISTGAG